MTKKLLGASLSTAILFTAAALPVLAQSSTPSSSASSVGACVAAAIDTRDTAVSAAVGALSTSWQNAISARSTASKAAWGMTDVKARRGALRAADQTFRDAMKGIRKTYRNAVRAAWNKFRDDRKACGVKGSGGDPISEGRDAL